MKKFAKVMVLMLVVVMSLALLVSCAPNSNPDKAVEALKKNGYTGGKDSTVVPALLTIAQVKGVDCVVSGTKTAEDKDGNKKIETVTIVYFTSSDTANDAWEKMQKFSDEQNKDKNSDWTVAKSGAMIYYGTDAAIKAAR